MKLRSILFLITALLVFNGCEYQKLLKNGAPDAKLEGAKTYYNKGDYNRALPLLEDLIGRFRKREKAEDVYYYYAYTHYGMHDFYLASHHFRKFCETYRRSKYLEEASFMHAKCEYHKSLPYELDQTSTSKAIEKIQLFVNKFPSSIHIEECNELIDELRSKLHKKAFDGAMLYYNMGDYRSAVVAFKNTLIDYPDIPQIDKISFHIVESSFLYAKKSVSEKQRKRYNAALAECTEYYASDNQTEEHLLEVKRIEKECRTLLADIKANEKIKAEKLEQDALKSGSNQ